MRGVLVVVGVALGVFVLGLTVAVLASIGTTDPNARTVPVATPNVAGTVQAQVRATVGAVAPTATSVPARPALGHPKIGENGWIYAERATGEPANQVGVSGSPSDSIAFWKSLNAKDDIGVQQLFRTNRLMLIAVGTRVLVIDSLKSDIDLLQVRFIDGEWPTTTAWLESLWIVSRLPPGFTPPTPGG